MDKVRSHFLSNLRRGSVLRSEDLKRYAEARNIPIDHSRLVSLRRLWKFTAMFEKSKKRLGYMSSTHFRYGVCQMDLAFISGKSFLSRRNAGYKGFLICVEISSLQVAAVPIKSRTYKELMRAIRKVVRSSAIRSITTLLTDRETTFKSTSFIRKVKEKLGIKIAFLKRRHKAYYAELFNSIIKRNLGMTLAYKGHLEKRDPSNWVKSLPKVVKALNDRNVPGTDMKRRSIGKHNFIEMLCKKAGAQDPYAGMNTSSLPASAIRSRDWKRQIFKYRVGTVVLVEERALSSNSPSGRFPKRALRGSRARRPYTVVAAALKRGGPFTLAPVYKIQDRSRSGPPLTGWFYQSELVPIKKSGR